MNLLAIDQNILRHDAIITIREHNAIGSKNHYSSERLRETLKGRIEFVEEWLYIRSNTTYSMGERHADDTGMVLVKELDAYLKIEFPDQKRSYEHDAAIALYQKGNDYAIKTLDRPTKFNILLKGAGWSR